MNLPSPSALRVFLVRHAHAAWAMPGVRDFDRPLDDRGREEAVRLAATMVVNGFNPDLIYCSNARRCVETLAILLADRSDAPRLKHSDELYTGNHEAYLELISSVRDDTVQSVMIVGHNPMIEEAAEALLRASPAALEDTIGRGFPTAGMLIVDCARKGRTAIDGSARLVELLSPRDA